jgi:hypothetical protein
VALCVADSLGFRLIDEQILARAADEAGVDQEAIAAVERRTSALVRLVEGLAWADSTGLGYIASTASATGQRQADGDRLRELIRSAIEETASKGSAVILAHAASLALASRGDVLRVLVTASQRARARRMASTLGVDERKAARAVRRSDAGRADYIKRFYGIGAELPTHYDLVVNTDRLAPERAAGLIVEAT